MTRVIDITEKLGLEGRPEIVIGKTRVEVDNSARTMLQVMGIVGDGADGVSPADVESVYELLFSEADRKKLDKLGLAFDDFVTLVDSAITLVTGGDGEGEAGTPATA